MYVSFALYNFQYLGNLLKSIQECYGFFFIRYMFLNNPCS